MPLANFLAAEGILVPAPLPPLFTIPSSAIHSLLMNNMVPLLQHPRPTNPVPFTHNGNSLDVLQLIKLSLPYFDHFLVTVAFRVAHKQCQVAGPWYLAPVPQEDVYHTELFATLRLWLSTQLIQVISHPNSGLDLPQTATTQEKRSEAAKKTDIILNLGTSKILLELVATATNREVKNHFQRALRDSIALKIQHACVVHFTVIEESIEYKYPFPAPNEHVMAIHVWHDVAFSRAKIVYLLDTGVRKEENMQL